jgi:hypothetical protein
MAENKADIEAERDQLRVENEQLRSQLSAVGAGAVGRAAVPQHTFQLSEGDRQELEIRGVINVGGRQVTKADVEAMLGESQRNVEIKDAPEGTRVAAGRAPRRGSVEGVDYVWPSVQPGGIDPKVAGTPGISGPSADALPDAAADVKPTAERTEV